MGEGLGLEALHPAQLNAASPIRFLPSGRRKFRLLLATFSFPVSGHLRKRSRGRRAEPPSAPLLLGWNGIAYNREWRSPTIPPVRPRNGKAPVRPPGSSGPSNVAGRH
jgi:hypothetical protein